MKKAYLPHDLRPVNPLAERLLRPDVEIANLTALREADQATVASLEIINKELADALAMWRAAPPLTPRQPLDKDEPNGYLESLTDWIGEEKNAEAVEWFLENRDNLISSAEAALRAAGRTL